MKRFIPVFLIVCLMLASCTYDKPAEIKKADFISFYDATGGEISLPKKPQKVAILFSSLADIWVTAGGAIDITVGETVSRGFADSTAVLVDEGAGHSTIDLETLISASPDLVIGTADYPCQADACSFCAAHGIPAVALSIECFADYLNALSLFTKLNECPENYDIYGLAVKSKIELLLSSLPIDRDAPRVLFLRVGTGPRSTKAKTAENNFVCTMLNELGAYNIADSAPVLLDGLSLETIVDARPDFIFLSPMGDENASIEYGNALLTEPGWRDLEAVRSGNVYFLPKALFHFKPNARWDEAYRILAELLYPEVRTIEN